MISGSAGTTSATFMKNDKTSSTQVPSRYPDTRPMTRATTVANSPPNMPTMSDTRVPQISWLRMSAPWVVVPNRCAALVGSTGPNDRLSARYGAMNGAKIATRTYTASRITPKRAFFDDQMTCHHVGPADSISSIWAAAAMRRPGSSFELLGGTGTFGCV